MTLYGEGACRKMKIAIVYNRESRNVINLFGMPNQERIGLRTIRRLATALRRGGHEVVSLEGDKQLIDRLEEFMPRVVEGERPGMVFNISYGIQGQARYTHVPSILEMAGIPYVASGPLGHSLALDKAVAKIILKQHDVPTPDFTMLEAPDSPIPDIRFPLIVKPKNEAVSFGLKVVHDESELREASKVIFDRFRQAVLAEQYIEGREINVGLLGNDPPEAFPPVELDFGEGPKIYTYEDKTGRSERTISHVCPAPLSSEQTAQACEIAAQAFKALNLYDCARVDMRLDDEGNFYVLEVNSLPSLGEHGSYLVGASAVGLDFEKFANRLVEVASARYFGMPEPVSLDVSKVDPKNHAVSYITQRRRQIETSLRQWVGIPSRTSDPIGIRQATEHATRIFENLGLKEAEEFTDEPETIAWETRAGMEGGVLLIAQLDVPLDPSAAHQPFRRTPEHLFGEGVGRSRAPLVMLECAFRSLRSLRRLRHLKAGVLLYADEGRSARHSARFIQAAAAKAKEVFVLRPGTTSGGVITRRNGVRIFTLNVTGESLSLSSGARREPPIRWTMEKLQELSRVNSPQERIALSIFDVRTQRHPMRLPHKVVATLVLNYRDSENADRAEEEMRDILGRRGPKWDLSVQSARPPFAGTAVQRQLSGSLTRIASELSIPLRTKTSAWPSVAGLIPRDTPCVCGVGPTTIDAGTPQEAIERISLVQRTLLLATFLASKTKG